MPFHYEKLLVVFLENSLPRAEGRAVEHYFGIYRIAEREYDDSNQDRRKIPCIKKIAASDNNEQNRDERQIYQQLYSMGQNSDQPKVEIRSEIFRPDAELASTVFACYFGHIFPGVFPSVSINLAHAFAS